MDQVRSGINTIFRQQNTCHIQPHRFPGQIIPAWMMRESYVGDHKGPQTSVSAQNTRLSRGTECYVGQSVALI